MLAAAPGVKAPLIAVLLRGDRAPAATDMRAALAGGGRRALSRPGRGLRCRDEKHACRERRSPAAIDAVAFSTLEKSVGVKTLIEILQCYIVTAEQLTNALAEACAEEKWDEAARLAQDIVGAAGGLGLAAVTQAARHFAQSARRREPHELRNAAQMVVGEHVRARQALIQSLSRRGLKHPLRHSLACDSPRSHPYDAAMLPAMRIAFANSIALVPAPPGAAICARRRHCRARRPATRRADDFPIAAMCWWRMPPLSPGG